MWALRYAPRQLQHQGLPRACCLATQPRAEEIVSLTEGGEIGIASGAPEAIYARKVLIYAPARTAGQQGKASTIEKAGKGPGWKLLFQTQQKWENPLIGWTSTADPMDSVARATMNFYTQEEAEAFCRKHGWAYEVQAPKEQTEARPKRFLGYGDNFSVKRHGYPKGGLKSEEGTGSEKGR